MGKNSQIQWTASTHNFWIGCQRVSAGCKFCYADRDMQRWNKDFNTVTKTVGFRKPLSWKEPQLVFINSWSDFFIKEADQWRVEAWEVIKATPYLTYQILTKRPERIAKCLPEDWGDGYNNVWLGVSCENQENYDKRFLQIAFYKTTFLSLEPLLGPIDLQLNNQVDLSRKVKDLIQWVIIGGESGNESGKFRYRECKESWILDIIDQCVTNNVPVFVKQMGTHISKANRFSDRHGGDINEWNKEFQIREMPKRYQAQNEVKADLFNQ